MKKRSSTGGLGRNCPQRAVCHQFPEKSPFSANMLRAYTNHTAFPRAYAKFQAGITLPSRSDFVPVISSSKWQDINTNVMDIMPLKSVIRTPISVSVIAIAFRPTVLMREEALESGGAAGGGQMRPENKM